MALEVGDRNTAARCLLNLTGLKLNHHQLDAAEKYHLQLADLRLKDVQLVAWQFNEADIAAAHGNYANAVVVLREALQQIDENAHQHSFDFKEIWRFQSSLASDYAAQGNNSEAEKWFQRSIATIDAGAKTLKHQELRTGLRDNTPVYDGYVAFLIAQKRFAEALKVAQLGRARTLLSDEEHPTPKTLTANNAKVWLSKLQRYLARDKSVLLSYFETADECYLWTVTANQLRLSTLGIKQPDLDNLIDSYQQEIQQHLPLASSPAAKKLYQLLVQPASDLTQKALMSSWLQTARATASTLRH